MKSKKLAENRIFVQPSFATLGTKLAIPDLSKLTFAVTFIEESNNGGNCQMCYFLIMFPVNIHF